MRTLPPIKAPDSIPALPNFDQLDGQKDLSRGCTLALPPNDIKYEEIDNEMMMDSPLLFFDGNYLEEPF